MPCPEKFKETLVKYGVDKETIQLINNGYEDIVSKTPKKIKAAYFKRAMDILDENVSSATNRDILDHNACCKGGSREKASKLFAKENSELTFDEKLDKIKDEQYMGNPIKNDDGTIIVHAIYYKVDDTYLCPCPNFNKLKRDYPVSKTYCYCCGGHFRHHYEIMLGCKLEVIEVVSSPLNSGGKNPCVFKMRIV